MALCRWFRVPPSPEPRRVSTMPSRIGFGISNKQTLEAAQNNAAGAIIGSKFVTLLNESKNADEALDKLFAALKS